MHVAAIVLGTMAVHPADRQVVINYAYTVKSKEYFMLLRILLIVIFHVQLADQPTIHRCASCLRLRPCILVCSIFPSVTYTIRQLLYTIRQLLYAFLWVIPRRLNFVCRRFGTVPSS